MRGEACGVTDEGCLTLTCVRDTRDERFSALYQRYWRSGFGYLARRRVPKDDVGDLVSEVFTVAWRRLDELPAEDKCLPWLLTTARNLGANNGRQLVRDEKLVATLRGLAREFEANPADHVVASRVPGPLAEAFDQLSSSDRELLLLVAWDELSPVDAAKVLGLRRGAARVRLHRARMRFAEAYRDAIESKVLDVREFQHISAIERPS